MSETLGRAHAFNTVMLASTCVESDLEQACAVGAEAVRVATRLRSARVLRYIADLRGRLRPARRRVRGAGRRDAGSGRVALIYHIAEAADWAQARDASQYLISTRGRTLAEQGYIHAGTAEQVAPVANWIYVGLDDLVVLVIDEDRIAAEVRYEDVPGWDRPFPHIYGPLNVDAVIETRPLVAGTDGTFTFTP